MATGRPPDEISDEPGEPDAPDAPDEIDGYRVLGVRARAASRGRDEYDARDPDSGRRVILRMLRESGTEPSDLARLRREAKTLAELAHPNIAPARGLGVYRGRLFIVMDADDGTPLDRLVRAESPSWRQVVAWLVEAGRGLAAAHARAIVHRQIRPGAIAIAGGADGHGRARIGDFGLGLPPWQGAASPRDAPLEALLVMAPEHLRGRRATIYSDQFAFCVTLWQAVTGAHPLVPAAAHPLDRDALLDALSRDDPPAPPRPLPRQFRRLWRALAPGLHPDPAQRYGSMHELLSAIETAARPAWRALWPRR